MESQKSAQVPVAPLYCACIVGRSREAPTVTVTMPSVWLDDFSLNTTGEGNMLTIVLSDDNINTTCNPGFMASILTECVRAHGTMSEFFNTSPDHKNVTFEETDAAQDGDQWEYDIAPKKGPVPRAVRGVYASLQVLSYLRMILKSDDVTLITVTETDNRNFQTQLIP